MDPLDPQLVCNDAAVLRDFQKSQAHDVWRKYVELMIKDSTFSAIQRSAGDWEKGIVEGLRLSLEVPAKVIVLAKQG